MPGPPKWHKKAKAKKAKAKAAPQKPPTLQFVAPLTPKAKKVAKRGERHSRRHLSRPAPSSTTQSTARSSPTQSAQPQTSRPSGPSAITRLRDAFRPGGAVTKAPKAAVTAAGAVVKVGTTPLTGWHSHAHLNLEKAQTEAKKTRTKKRLPKGTAAARKQERAAQREARLSNQIARQKQALRPGKLKVGGASISRKLPKPGLRVVPKKPTEGAQKQLKKQERKLEQASNATAEIRLVRELLPDELTKGQKRKEVKQADRRLSAFLGDSLEGQALRRAGILPKVRVPKAREGGRTVAEATRALQESERSGETVSTGNVTVARGAWKEHGGGENRLKYMGAMNVPAIQEVAVALASKRAPTAEEVLSDPKVRRDFLVEVTRTSYKDAAEKNLPVGRSASNPWALSDAQAPADETAAERRQREAKVLAELIKTGKFDAAEAQRERDVKRQSVIDGLIDPDAFKRQFVEGPKNSFEKLKSDPRVWALEISTPGMGHSETSSWQDIADVASIATTLSIVTGAGLIARGGIKGGSIFARAALSKTAEGGRLGVRGGASAVLQSTRPGRWYIGAVSGLGTKNWRRIRAGAGFAIATGAAVGKDYTLPIVEATVTANVPKAAQATARTLVAAVVQPIAWLNAGTQTARRHVQSIGEPDDYYASSEYMNAPVVRLAEEALEEIKLMAETLTSKDVARIREFTENDIGYIIPMSSYWVTRLTVGQSVKSSAAVLSAGAKQIAASPAGRALAREIALTNPGLAAQVRAMRGNVQGHIDGAKAAKEKRQNKRQAVAVAGREIGDAETLKRSMEKDIIKPKQVLLMGSTGKRSQNFLDRFNKGAKEPFRDSNVKTSAPAPVEIESIATTMARGGIELTTKDGGKTRLKTAPELRVELVQRRKTLKNASTEYRILSAAIEMLDGGISFHKPKMFQAIYGALRKNDTLLDFIRYADERGGISSQWQELRDREVRATDVYAAEARAGGDPMPVAPRDEQSARRAEREAAAQILEREMATVEQTATSLAKELNTNNELMVPLVEQARQEVRDRVKGKKLEEDLRSTAERVLDAEIKAIDIPNLLYENRLQRVKLRRELDRPYPPVSKSEKAEIEAEIKALKDEAVSLREQRSQAIKDKVRLRHLEKVAARLVENPDPKLLELHKRADEIGRQLRSMEATMAGKYKAHLEAYGLLGPTQVEAVVSTFTPEIKAAINQSDGLSRSIEVLRAEHIELDGRAEMAESTLRIINGDKEEGAKLEAEIAEIESVIAEIKKAMEDAPLDKATGNFSPTIGQGIINPKEVARFLKEEYGIVIPEAEIKRVSDAQLRMAWERYEQLDSMKAVVDEAGKSRKAKRAIRGELKVEAREARSAAFVISENLRIQESQRRVLLAPGESDAAMEQFLAQERKAQLEERLLDEYRMLVEEYERGAAEIMEARGIGRPTYMVFDSESPGRDMETPRGDTILNDQPDEVRRGRTLEEEGRVDTTISASFEAYKRQIDRRANRRTAEHLARHALVAIKWDDGTMRTVFDNDEVDRAIELYKEQHGVDLDPVAYKMSRKVLDHDDSVGEMLTGLAQKKKFEDVNDAVSGEIDSVLPAHVAYDPVYDSPTRRAKRNLQGLQPDTGVVFVRRAQLDVFAHLNRDMNGFEQVFFALNRVSSRLVLGSSLAWMFAQPIAEMLVAVAEHPVKIWPALIETRRIQKEGGAAAASLARQAQSTPGANPISGRRARLGFDQAQRDFAAATGFAKLSPFFKLINLGDPDRPRGTRSWAKQQAVDAATFKLPGKFDRWKAAWIREAGVLAELDSQLSGFTRAGNAVRGQITLIETHANKLLKMNREEQLKWLYSQEGYDVGMELAKKIDDQMGNWQDLAPGLESYVGQMVFFYPFVRFSLKWALRTYPREHPVIWTLANVMGVANTNMLERLVEYDPAWPQDWAAAPFFGAPGKDAPPTSLINMGRYTTAGNAGTELIAGRERDPVVGALNVAVPAWGIIGRALYRQDEYGNPLRDDSDGFMGPGVKFLSRKNFGNVLDSAGRLTVYYREIQRATGFSIGGLVGRNDSAFSPPQQNRLGRDPNFWQDQLRRNLFPAWPMPAHLARDASLLNKLFQEREEIRKHEGAKYLYKGKERVRLIGPTGKTRLIPFREAYAIITNADELAEKVGTERKYSGLWDMPIDRNRKYHRDLVETYEKIEQQNLEARDAVTDNLKKQRDLHSARGADLSPNTEAAKRREQDIDRNRSKRWREWNEVFPGTPYPDNEDEARRMWRAAENNGVRLSSPVTGVNENGVSVGSDAKDGAQVVRDLRADTRERLAAAGKRRVDLSDPTIDPETRTNKKGYVTRYRGAKVAGNVGIKELREAEQTEALDYDPKTEQLRTPRIRGIQVGQREVAVKLRKLKRKNERMSRANDGMPSGVPAEYAKWIRKYSPRIDKQSREVYGLSGNEFMAKMLQGESGFDMSKVGPDIPQGNARGAAQFIPSTRRDFMNQFGIDPWRSVKEAVQGMAIHLDGESYSKVFGIQGYNPGINDSYYLEQDVGEVVPGKKVDPEVLKRQQEAIKELEQQLKGQNTAAEQAGLDPVRVLPKPTLWIQPKKKKGPGTVTWLNGTSPEGLNPDLIAYAKTISRMSGYELEITSALRPHSTGSNHQIGGALDINAIADGGESEKKGDAIAYAAVIAAGGTKEQAQQLASGAIGYLGFQSPNGHAIELLWKGDPGHRDHVHIALDKSGNNRGERVFRGRRVIGPGVLNDGMPMSVPGGGGGGYGGGGGGGVPGVAPMDSGVPGQFALDRTGTAASWRDEPLMDMDYGGESAYREAGVDTAVENVAAAALDQPDEGAVESTVEELAPLPQIQRRKKKVPRFDPNRSR